MNNKEKSLLVLACISAITGCSRNTAPVVDNIGAGNANASIQSLLNFNFDEAEYISDDTKEKVKEIYDKYLADGTDTVKINITDKLDEFILYCEGELREIYARNTGIGNETNITDEEEQLNESSGTEYINNYDQEILDINKSIRELKDLKIQNYTRFLNLLHSTCNRYRSVPDQYKGMIYDVDLLGLEVEQVGGSLETNFNLESAIFYYEAAITGDYESDYDGPTDEELGIVQGHEYSGTSTDDDSYDDEVYDAVEGNDDNQEQAEDVAEVMQDIPEDTSEVVENTSEVVEETQKANTDSIEETVADEDYDAEISETLEDSDVITEDIDSDLKDWIDAVYMDGDSIEVDKNKLLEHIGNLSDNLIFENNQIYVEVTTSTRIDLADGYYIDIQRDSLDDWQLDVQDYFYWDDGTFNVSIKNRSLASVNDMDLTGVISGGKIEIHNIDELTIDIDPINVSVWKDDISDEEE